ncbi:sensor histidine kinase [Microlunatus sp. GCM10028923]|uniref:sensor histidine kinase n=1 Tax=Microlunatus sp. GCM10028923 TaxID=3273400 RepID=UPI00361A56D4
MPPSTSRPRHRLAQPASAARVRDAERRRIQQQLHDGLQQELVALVAQLGLARSSLDRKPAAARELINEAYRAAQRIVDDLRDLVHGIYPSVLSDLGLVAAIEASVSRLPIPLAVTSSAELRTARFPLVVEESAYFFVAEALTNVIKHASATRVAVRLTRSDGTIRIQIQDDGSGLPSSVRTGFGLTALRDRIRTVNGSMTMAEAINGGAMVQARIPTMIMLDSSEYRERRDT